MHVSSNFNRITPFALCAVGLVVLAGCQPGAGSVEIWTTPRPANWDYYDREPMSVSVGDQVQIDGHRKLPGTAADASIKPLRNFKFYCKPAGTVEFDAATRTLTFTKPGSVRVWLVESAPSFAFQSQQPEGEWDESPQTKCRSNTLLFDVK